MSAYRDWYVGMRVVCVRENKCKDWPGYYALCKYPVLNEVYTLRWIGILEGHVGVLLQEIVNPIGDFSKGLAGESVFYADQFRPVDTRRPDISIFTAMLTDQRRKVEA